MLVCVGLSFVRFISWFKFVCGLHDFWGVQVEGSVVTRFSVLLVCVLVGFVGVYMVSVCHSLFCFFRDT